MPKLQILGIPCNQFGAQEPGDEEEIKAFVAGETANSRGLQLSGGLKGASNFTLLAKSAINGNGTHPIFKLAKDKFPGETNWNFADMLIFDENGDLQTRHSAGTRSPLEGPLLEAATTARWPGSRCSSCDEAARGAGCSSSNELSRAVTGKKLNAKTPVLAKIESY